VTDEEQLIDELSITITRLNKENRRLQDLMLVAPIEYSEEEKNRVFEEIQALRSELDVVKKERDASVVIRNDLMNKNAKLTSIVNYYQKQAKKNV
jgi:hypothetical protein